jgi:hypothetical protein
MDVRELRGWLLCQPRPVSLRIVSADQQAHKLDIVQGVSWIQAAESVAALQPDLVEALDKDGNLIRAIRPNDVEAEEEKVESPSQPSDPETLRLITFAKLLAEAYKHSTETAFDKLVALFDASNRRSELLERSLTTTERLLRKAYEDQIATALESAGGAAAAAGGSFEETMLAALMQGKAQAAATKANGVHPTPQKEDEES